MYKVRFIEREIEKKLRSSYAVNVVGPKFCGKTTTCNRFAKSEIKLISRDLIDLVKVSPSIALDGNRLRLIDEWQAVPILFDKIRELADTDDNKFGQFLITGSSTPPNKDEIMHSGSGRIATVKMRTMSLFESGESLGLVSINELFDNEDFVCSYMNSQFDLKDLVFLIERGGWPLSVLIDNREDAIESTKSYYSSLFDFKNYDDRYFRNKKPEIVKMLLRAYARNVSTEASDAKLISDVVGFEARTTFSFQSFSEYNEVLKDLYLVENVGAWCPKLRSRAIVRSKEVRHFLDTSIAMNALEITGETLLKDAKTLGFFFEDFAIRDLSIYANAIDAKINHYRDSDGLECDCIIHRKDGKYGFIEIKLGSKEAIEFGKKNLLNLKEKIDSSFYDKPSFMMVVTSNGPCYKTEEGIHVVPINLLRE